MQHYSEKFKNSIPNTFELMLGNLFFSNWEIGNSFSFSSDLQHLETMAFLIGKPSGWEEEEDPVANFACSVKTEEQEPVELFSLGFNDLFLTPLAAEVAEQDPYLVFWKFASLLLKASIFRDTKGNEAWSIRKQGTCEVGFIDYHIWRDRWSYYVRTQRHEKDEENEQHYYGFFRKKVCDTA